MNSRYSNARIIKAVSATIVGLALASGTMGLSCDSDAQAIFRQSATGQIGEGVKELLGGDSEQAAGTIVSAAIDGLVASIQQAGDGPSGAK